MDPSLMTPEELSARGSVFIDPCGECRHNRQTHVYIPRPDMATGYLASPITACLACDCREFTDG